MTDAFRNPQTPYVQPVVPKTPKVPKAGSPGWKAFTEKRWAANHPNAGTGAPVAPKAPAVTPTSTAMDAFRMALAQLNASTPAVDSNAIYAPYRASEAVTGQLGQGYQQAEQQAGAAAQQQYATGRDQAQQRAAAFGISAGAGANPTALTDNGTQALASQTAAYTAAAPAATAQWQALLERTAGAKVSDAQLAREQGLTAAKQSLSTALPGAIGNEEDRAFQKKTEADNMGLALTQLSAKDRQFAQQYGLDALKLKLQGQQQNTTNTISQDRLDEQKRHNLQTEKGARVRAQKAAAKGAQGMPQVLAALKISGSSTSSKRTAKGWDVTIQPWDTANDKPSGPVKVIHAARSDYAPPGYKNVGNATTHYESVSATSGGGMTLAQWNKAVGVYQTYNKVSRAQAIKAVQQITPRPPK